MDRASITHGVGLTFRQPIARNQIRFRLLAADGDLAACMLVLWKRSEPYPDTRRAVPMRPRYHDVSVPTIEETLNRVKLAGGKILYPMTSVGELGSVAEFEDSEGNCIALHSAQKAVS